MKIEQKAACNITDPSLPILENMIPHIWKHFGNMYVARNNTKRAKSHVSNFEESSIAILSIIQDISIKTRVRASTKG